MFRNRLLNTCKTPWQGSTSLLAAAQHVGKFTEPASYEKFEHTSITGEGRMIRIQRLSGDLSPAQICSKNGVVFKLSDVKGRRDNQA